MKTKKISASQIKHILQDKSYYLGINLYPGEPTNSQHAVSIRKGHAREAIKHLQAQGYSSGHAYAFGPYSESIWVKR